MRCRYPLCSSIDAEEFCGRCGLFAYCSKRCQSLHWPSHKLYCNKPSCLAVNGYRLTLEEEREYRLMLPNVANRDFSAGQLRTRGKTAQGIASAVQHSLSPTLRQVYQKYPTYAFYKDERNRPVRVFGAMDYNSSGVMHLHSITLKRDGSSYFTLGGTPADTLTTIAEWDPTSVKVIAKSKIPGLFLDPLGNQLAATIAEDTGYDVLSANMCSCCCHNGQRLPTDRPVLLSPEHMRAMTERCAECKQLKRSHLCGRCKKVRYCSMECQEKAWPKHKRSCNAAN